MPESKSLMSRQAICACLRISKTRFYNLVKEGLPVTKLGGGWSGNLDEIDDFVRKRAAQPRGPKKAS